jgi:hypothetical protein
MHKGEGRLEKVGCAADNRAKRREVVEICLTQTMRPLLGSMQAAPIKGQEGAGGVRQSALFKVCLGR